jgi:hypothetical protein
MRADGKLRFASVGQLALGAGIALVSAVVLDKVGARGSEFFVGILIGFGAGLGFMALAAWQRQRV